MRRKAGGFGEFPMKSTPDSSHSGVGVLVLHGMSLSLVQYVKVLFRSLGLKAYTVGDLPSLGLNLDQKVEHYIQECELPIVIATYDEGDSDSDEVRLNVNDELARCLRLGRTDAIVLQEERGGKPVKFGSNISSNLPAIIRFRLENIHELIPKLLVELVGREIIAVRNHGERKSIKILEDFLDNCVKLWEEEIDGAWYAIHELDFEVESRVTHSLDKFFDNYHKVMESYVKKGKRGPSLEELCEYALNDGWREALHAWQNVAEAKMKLAKSLIGQKSSKATTDIIKRAENNIRKGLKMRNYQEGVKHFREASRLLDEFHEVVIN